MNRLQAELRRLYLPDPSTAPAPAPAPHIPWVIGADGQVRAMVLGLARPADWGGLATVWQGVQADLELPAPAIAVTGVDGYQLWFSLAVPVPAAQAFGFLDALRRRYLGQVKPQRLTLVPGEGGPQDTQALPVPGLQEAGGQWSAFVAPDLASLFADEPWLDLEPSPDAQADLLSSLKSVKPAEFERALERLAPTAAADDERPGPAGVAHGGVPGGPLSAPERFLLEVMNDPGVALPLRIEAAKALLPHLGPAARSI